MGALVEEWTAEFEAEESAGATEVAAAVAAADPALLLMSLVHMTGDRSLLRRYASVFRPLAVRSAQAVHEYDEDEVAEIRRAVLDRLGADRRTREPLVLPVPDPALFREMAELCTGGEVAAEFVPLLMEQAGFVTDDRVLRPTRTPQDVHVVVIGAGMVGINAGVKLGLAGFDYTIFEARGDLGGTWSINTYPGAAVDTPSHYYSFSFELNPDWSRYYPVGPDYLRYLEFVADKYGVRDHVRFDTRVLGCRWDEAEQLWIVTTSSGGVLSETRAHAVLTAVGTLNRPNKPAMRDQDRFRGVVMHSAEWDDSVDLAGKKVVVLGTGCTSVQLVSTLAPQVDRMTVVQRQPHWMAPGIGVMDPVPAEERWALANIPYFHQWMRLRTYWFQSDNNYAKARIDPEWAASHELSTSPDNDALLQVCLKYLDVHFGDDPEMKAKLTPDFPPYAKRIVKDPGFFDTLKMPNVALETGTVERFTETGVVLSGGQEIECDVLLLATGFQLEYLTMLDIVGRDGRTLAETWGDDPKAYLGITVPGFPNLFTGNGPNSGANHGGGHNLVGEEHVHFMIECLQLLVERGASSLEPRADLTAEYSRRVDEAMDQTVWQHGGTAHGYYRNAAGRARIQCPWRMVDYWTMLRTPDPEHFVLR